MRSKQAGQWRRHTVIRYEPYLQVGNQKLAALRQVIENDTGSVTGVPSMVYMPEKDQLLMLMMWDKRPQLLSSNDHGATWAGPRPIAEIKSGSAMWLAYLGNGKVMLAATEESGNRLLSDDFGETWPLNQAPPPAGDDFPRHEWDRPMVDIDPASGSARRIISTAYRPERPYAPYYDPSCGCLRISSDMGRTWAAEYLPPQWKGVNEVFLSRAANGDIVAACRTEWLEEHRYRENVQAESDHYSGLAYSISKDDGKSWSDMRILYRFGRHHPSMVLLPSDELVLIYVVRKGYPKHPSGYDQYGIEALVSRDNGQSWDLERPYVLDIWKALRKDENAWWASCQGTSSLVLPDGDILTSYAGGFRARDGYFPRDVGLVRWRINPD